MGKLQQNLIHFVILALVTTLFWWLQPSPQLTSHGILLSNGKSYPATTTQMVKVLGHFPAHYTDLGLIRTTHHFSSTSTDAQNQEECDNLEYARQLAAQAGANAIVVTLLGRSNEVGPLDGTILYARAIHTD